MTTLRPCIYCLLAILFSFQLVKAQYNMHCPPITGQGGIPNEGQGALSAISPDGFTAVSAFHTATGGGGFFIFRKVGQNWVQQKRFNLAFWHPNNSSRNGGIALSADGNTVACTGFIQDSIKIFVFENNVWRQQAVFKSKTPAYNKAEQNTALSYDGNTLVYDAQVFIRTAGQWSLQATLMPTDRPVATTETCDSANRFSCYTSAGISADGNTVVIGDSYSPDTTTNAWVFVRNGTTWTQQGPRLQGTGNNGQGYTLYASAVAVSGDGNTLGIGSYSKASIWIFIRQGNVWTEQAGPLKSVSSTQSSYSTGTSMAFTYNGNSMVAGRTGNSFTYWKRSGTNWHQIGDPHNIRYDNNYDRYNSNGGLTSPVSIDSAGLSVLLSKSGYAGYLGAAFYFTAPQPDTFAYVQKIRGTGNVGQSEQGTTSTISRNGTTLVVGAPIDNGNQGAIWIYKRNGSEWVPASGKLTVPGNIWKAAQYGTSVAVSGNGSTVAVGAPAINITPNGNGSGCVYVYEWNGTTYIPQVDSITITSVQRFGSGVSLSDDGNTLLVGSILDGAYVYLRNGNTWAYQATLPGGNGGNENVKLSGDGTTAVFSNTSYLNSKGALYIYKRTGNTWAVQATAMTIAGLGALSRFPYNLDISYTGDLVVAALWQGGAGLITTTRRTGTSWSALSSNIMPPTPLGINQNGRHIALSSSGDSLLTIAAAGSVSYTKVYILKYNGSTWDSVASIRKFDPSTTTYIGSPTSASISGDLSYIALGFSNSGDGCVRVYKPMAMYDTLLLRKDATCAQLADGKIRIKMFAGATPYTYTWSNGGSNTDSLTNLLPGTYTLTVTDASGDTLIRQYMISSLSTFHTDNFATSFSCTSGLGNIYPIVVGGTAPYSYLWNTSPAQTTASATNILPGSYSYTVSDNAGCIYTDTIELSAASYYPSLTSTLPNCFSDGSATIIMYGGQAPYTYSWSNGAVTQTVNNLAAGNYTATVTDAAGCSVTGNFSLPSSCNNTISGTVFFDRNNNCVVDGIENPAVGYTMVATDGVYNAYGSTDATGAYTITLPQPGVFTVRIANWQQCSYHVCSDSIYPVTVTLINPGDSAPNTNFALLDTEIDLAVEVQNPDPFPGSSFNYTIYYGNLKDTMMSNGVVTMVYSPLLILNNTVPGYTTHDAANHTITWNVNNIGFLHPYNQYVRANFTVPTTVLPATWLHMQSSIAPTANDCNTVNNTVALPFMVTGSLDPNYKESYPKDYLLTGDSTIIYTIHFQNTGIDSTHFIEILDTLPVYLDPASVQTVGACYHPYKFEIKGDRVLSWLFDPFALPDSATDPINSQGYVSFRVKTKGALPLGTVVRNTAYIYFDYNEPVQTNTIENIVTEPTYIPKQHIALDINVYPNPFNTSTTFELPSDGRKYQIDVTDMTGRNVAQLKPTNNHATLERNNLATGCYLYKVSVNKEIVGYGKLVIE